MKAQAPGFIRTFQTPPTPEGGVDTDVRREVFEFYSTHNPQKVGKVCSPVNRARGSSITRDKGTKLNAVDAD